MCSDVDQVATQAFKNDMAALAIRLLALGRAELKEYIDRECSTCGLDVPSSIDIFPEQKAKFVQNIIDLFQRQRPKFDFAITLENADEATKMNLFEQRLKQMMIPDAASSFSEIAPPTEADVANADGEDSGDEDEVSYGAVEFFGGFATRRRSMSTMLTARLPRPCATFARLRCNWSLCTCDQLP